MDEPTENEREQAVELFAQFTESLDEVNDRIEVILEWEATGRTLGEGNMQRYVNKAEGLYRMATNVVENTDYTPEAQETEVLENTVEAVQNMPDYIADDSDFDYDF